MLRILPQPLLRLEREGEEAEAGRPRASAVRSADADGPKLWLSLQLSLLPATSLMQLQEGRVEAGQHALLAAVRAGGVALMVAARPAKVKLLALLLQSTQLLPAGSATAAVQWAAMGLGLSAELSSNRSGASTSCDHHATGVHTTQHDSARTSPVAFRGTHAIFANPQFRPGSGKARVCFAGTSTAGSSS